MINEYGEYLYGHFAGVDYAPTNESGYFIDAGNNLFAKEFKVSLSFSNCSYDGFSIFFDLIFLQLVHLICPCSVCTLHLIQLFIIFLLFY